ncbi:uncharacterized protein LOC130663750 [Microplitis mediator]|uniref:uncharacterized protein LOC103569119 n=1 Tax=Microplitis demolitor TaxID=69319 RepID=UPI0004CCDA39|nr:uncharacterized protein LOC103569119 [Microplitis demolitor]XP_057319168.1 uncharacterized protein LOC130663750 [Microplitis mediator]
MERKLRIKNSSSHHQRRSEFIDDECSTDSGCSSGGSTGSAEHLSRRQVNDPRSTFHHRCYINHVHYNNEPSTTRSQERLTRSHINSNQRGRTSKSSRSWSPNNSRQHTEKSPTRSSSPSDAHSTDSDSLKSTPKTDVFRRALQYLTLVKLENNSKEKKLTKKSPKKILRKPVSYTYVKGLSGLPTQRVPRTSTPEHSSGCSC